MEYHDRKLSDHLSLMDAEDEKHEAIEELADQLQEAAIKAMQAVLDVRVYDKQDIESLLVGGFSESIYDTAEQAIINQEVSI